MPGSFVLPPALEVRLADVVAAGRGGERGGCVRAWVGGGGAM